MRMILSPELMISKAIIMLVPCRKMYLKSCCNRRKKAALCKAGERLNFYLSAHMLAVVVIPTEDYYEEQAHGDGSANGGAGNTGDNKADKGEHTVNRSIGQLGAHMVHQITFCAHGG